MLHLLFFCISDVGDGRGELIQSSLLTTGSRAAATTSVSCTLPIRHNATCWLPRESCSRQIVLTKPTRASADIRGLSRSPPSGEVSAKKLRDLEIRMHRRFRCDHLLRVLAYRR